MPTVMQSYPSMRQDPFNNLTLEVGKEQVDISVHTSDQSTGIRLSHAEAKRFAEHLLKELGEEEIIGYLPGGRRIHPCRKDMIYTAAIVSCCGCHRVIRGAGGPMAQAMCPTCWEEK